MRVRLPDGRHDDEVDGDVYVDKLGSQVTR